MFETNGEDIVVSKNNVSVSIATLNIGGEEITLPRSKAERIKAYLESQGINVEYVEGNAKIHYARVIKKKYKSMGIKTFYIAIPRYWMIERGSPDEVRMLLFDKFVVVEPIEEQTGGDETD